ncbi:MAG: hypothetical protein HGA87_02660 [Desulfobulbaceae bacterium]|nr:hypothetical protein [Desulfobulbaceae bacterium]
MMKKLTLLAALALHLTTASPASAGWYRDANSWVQERTPLDHALHFGVGTGISYGLAKSGASPLVSVAVPVAIGLVKESTDKNFSTADLLSWAVGGVVGALLGTDTSVTCSGQGVGIEYKF